MNKGPFGPGRASRLVSVLPVQEVVSAVVGRHASPFSDVGLLLSPPLHLSGSFPSHIHRPFLTNEVTSVVPFPQEGGLVKKALCSHSSLVLLPTTFAVGSGLWLWPQDTPGSCTWGRLEFVAHFGMLSRIPFQPAEFPSFLSWQSPGLHREGCSTMRASQGVPVRLSSLLSHFVQWRRLPQSTSWCCPVIEVEFLAAQEMSSWLWVWTPSWALTSDCRGLRGQEREQWGMLYPWFTVFSLSP